MIVQENPTMLQKPKFLCYMINGNSRQAREILTFSCCILPSIAISDSSRLAKSFPSTFGLILGPSKLNSIWDEWASPQQSSGFRCITECPLRCMPLLKMSSPKARRVQPGEVGGHIGGIWSLNARHSAPGAQRRIEYVAANHSLSASSHMRYWEGENVAAGSS